MSFKKDYPKKGISLPGMIDMIFLLLIFSLVTLSYTNPDISHHAGGQPIKRLDLPAINSNLTEEKDIILTTLMFEVKFVEDDITNPRVLYVLLPSGDTTKYSHAKREAIEDARCDTFPDNFLNLNDNAFASLSACQLIRESINDYKKAHFLKPNLNNSVEIRADRNIEFRIFNYILDQCSAYGDTIPRVITRSLSY
ncbi:MAG: biopolymer transporter ExbD [bacterium]